MERSVYLRATRTDFHWTVDLGPRASRTAIYCLVKELITCAHLRKFSTHKRARELALGAHTSEGNERRKLNRCGVCVINIAFTIPDTCLSTVLLTGSDLRCARPGYTECVYVRYEARVNIRCFMDVCSAIRHGYFLLICACVIIRHEHSRCSQLELADLIYFSMYIHI